MADETLHVTARRRVRMLAPSTERRALITPQALRDALVTHRTLGATCAALGASPAWIKARPEMNAIVSDWRQSSALKTVTSTDLDIRPVPFAPGYLVSRDGHVFSEKDGPRIQLRPNTRGGHPSAVLRVAGVARTQQVARIVALVFIGPPPTEWHRVRHLDNSPVNNAVTNLAWRSESEIKRDVNARAATSRVPVRGEWRSHVSQARTPRGERHGMAKHTDEQVRALRREVDSTPNISEADRRVGMKRGRAYAIHHGRAWGHVV